jgi:hypothetical protein
LDRATSDACRRNFFDQHHVALRQCNEAPVCEKCQELDRKIEHFRMLAARVLDQPTIDGIHDLIKKMEAEKAELHPEQNQ